MSTDDADKAEEEADEGEPDAEEGEGDRATAKAKDDAGGSDDEAEDEDDGESDDEESEEEDDEGEDEEGEDEGEDEEGEDEGEEDEDDEGEEKPGAEKKGAKGKKKHGGLSPGERLAAAKARKAKKKSDKRGRQAEIVEDRVLKQAGVATDWMAENRRLLWVALGAVVLLAAGGTYWSVTSSVKATEASVALWDAVQAANGEIRSEGNIAGDQDEDSEIFDTREARAEATLERAQRVRDEYAGTPAAIWAALEAGTALLDLERWGDARESFQAALGQGGQNSAVALRALEGLAFSYEGENEWDQAISRFNELRSSGDGAFEEIADYHLARMHLAKGETERAKEVLAGLLESLRDEDDDRPDLAFIRSQAEIRLLELDSSLVPQQVSPSAFGIPGGGGGGLENIPPEILQKLLQQRQQGGGAGE